MVGIASGLSRTAPHKIKFVIDFVDGARNDVVKIYLDGTLKVTGTTWEDYYRFDPEQAGNGNQVPTVKKLTRAAGPLTGSSIRLYAPCNGHIGIAEGIETALAAQQASGVPTVAAYCAANLSSWRWPTGTHRIVVFADNDKTGRDAAERLRVRAHLAGVRCEILAPSTCGTDWCDVWAGRNNLLTEGTRT